MTHRSGISTYTITVLGHFNESPIKVCGLGLRGPHSSVEVASWEMDALLPSSQQTCLQSLKVSAFPGRKKRLAQRHRDPDPKAAFSQPAERLLAFQTHRGWKRHL